MKFSSGILCAKVVDKKIQVLLVHPGGPYYEGTDLNSWSIPKGLVETSDPELDARREFQEEVGNSAPEKLDFLGVFQTRSSKQVYAYVGWKDIDVSNCKSNYCEIQYCGEKVSIPEVDKWEWFELDQALLKIALGQKQIIQAFEYRYDRGFENLVSE